MNSSLIEITLIWMATALYALGTVLIAIGTIWSNKKCKNLSHFTVMVALVPHGISLLLRWYGAGRAPYQDLYEKLSGDAWWALLMYFILTRKWTSFKQLALFLYPATLLLTGWAVMSSKQITEVPATYRTVWLVIHVIFAKLAYGSALMATGSSIFYLIKTRESIQSNWLAKLPTLEQLDYYSYKLTTFAFLMIGVMIGAGAIWAHQAWGRYWFWDPIETWSLISWLVYGLYLHYRFTGGKPKNAAIMNVFALFILLITFFLTPYLYDSVHRS